MHRLWLVIIDWFGLSPRAERVLKRACKGAAAGFLAAVVMWLNNGMQPVGWQYFTIPAATAFVLALEKGLQKEKPETVKA